MLDLWEQILLLMYSRDEYIGERLQALTENKNLKIFKHILKYNLLAHILTNEIGS